MWACVSECVRERHVGCVLPCNLGVTRIYQSPILSSTGRLNDIYHDYKYTYQGCGIILIIASVFLFVGMGINYRLLDREKKQEERQAKVEARKDPGAKGREPENDVAVPLTATEVSKMAEDTV